MCRIAAVISEDKNNLIQKIDQMCDNMAHGGPDHYGKYLNNDLNYAFGHRRLSIIDTDSIANQPMSAINDNYIISFNGEIYNYLELRQELQSKGYIFKTNSDTEVLLYGYIEWKLDVLHKLQGMFAFVISDNTKKEIFAARDHAGMKPLYYSNIRNEFYISSEVKAFTSLNDNWEINEEWPVLFLTYGFIPEPYTTLKNVFSLKKGSYLTYNLKNNVFIEKKWFIPEYKNLKIKKTDIKYDIKKLLNESVKKHLISDVPIGVLLSGGLDSTLIAAISTQYSNNKIKTISLNFTDELYSEQDYQIRASKFLSTDHHEFLVDEKILVENFTEYLDAMDQPTVDGFNTYLICKFSSSIGIKVVLSGIGADEYFGGYSSFNLKLKYYKLFRRVPNLFFFNSYFPFHLKIKKFSFLSKKINNKQYLFNRGLYTPYDVSKILNVKKSKIYEILNKVNFDESPLLDERTYVSKIEVDYYLTSQLLKDADTFSMRHGVEIRMPFLDICLVNYINNINSFCKYSDKIDKILIKDLAKELLPSEIVYRKKIGFAVPYEKIINVNQKIRNKSKNHDLANSILDYFDNKYNKNIQSSNLNDTRIIFLALKTFFKFGGIEKVNSNLIFSANSSIKNFSTYCLYDHFCDIRYTKRSNFISFGGNKINFILKVTKNVFNTDNIIIGHMNFAPFVFFLKLIKPKLKLILYVHGIEAWKSPNYFGKWLYINSNKILSVSNFTKTKLLNNVKINDDKITVLYNSLSPFFKPIFGNYIKPTYLLEKYNISEKSKNILVVNRLTKGDYYKGYNHVFNFIHKSKLDINYFIVGNIDIEVYKEINEILNRLSIKNKVFIVGAIDDNILIDYYKLADVFLMPSIKEGFGISFIEATSHGLPVVAGNVDGSVEAVLNGELGFLINPNSYDEISIATQKAFEFNSLQRDELKNKTYLNFNFNNYSLKITEEIIM